MYIEVKALNLFVIKSIEKVLKIISIPQVKVKFHYERRILYSLGLVMKSTFVALFESMK